MVVLDTNIVIYLANGTLDVAQLRGHRLAFASISKIEALGYWNIRAAEQTYLEQLFDEWEQLDLDESVVKRTIGLRQRAKMSLGDAIIAATSLEYDCELWTANGADFSEVDGLRVRNPLSA